MPEGLSTADGKAIDLDTAEAEFHRAMAAPEPDEPEHAAPPKRVELSEAELGEKYGWTTGPGGERRAKRAKGRPSTKPRLTDVSPGSETASKPGKPKGQADAKADFSQPLSELTGALWMVMAAVPIPAEPLRVKVRAQAYLLREHRAGLIQGLNMMAQNNGVVRRGVEMLTMGGASWVLPACMAVAPFAVQSSQLWKMDPAELVGVAEATERVWAAEFAAMQAQLQEEIDEQAANWQAETGHGPEDEPVAA